MREQFQNYRRIIVKVGFFVVIIFTSKLQLLQQPVLGPFQQPLVKEVDILRHSLQTVLRLLYRN